MGRVDRYRSIAMGSIAVCCAWILGKKGGGGKEWWRARRGVMVEKEWCRTTSNGREERVTETTNRGYTFRHPAVSMKIRYSAHIDRESHLWCSDWVTQCKHRLKPILITLHSPNLKQTFPVPVADQTRTLMVARSKNITSDSPRNVDVVISAVVQGSWWLT